MEIDLPFGDTTVRVNVPRQTHVRYPQELPAVSNARTEIRRALDRPLGTAALSRLARGKSRPVIIINDATRPAPSRLMLEELLKDLAQAGI